MAVGVLVLALVVVAGIIGSLPSGGASYSPRPGTTTVNITAVNWRFTGASNCWGSNATNGQSVTGGSTFAVSIRLSYTAGLLEPNSCTVQSVGVSTSGFEIASANTPLIVPTGGSGTLSITLRAPNTNTTEALAVVCSVSSP